MRAQAGEVQSTVTVDVCQIRTGRLAPDPHGARHVDEAVDVIVAKQLQRPALLAAHHEIIPTVAVEVDGLDASRAQFVDEPGTLILRERRASLIDEQAVRGTVIILAWIGVPDE